MSTRMVHPPGSIRKIRMMQLTMEMNQKNKSKARRSRTITTPRNPPQLINIKFHLSHLVKIVVMLNNQKMLKNQTPINKRIAMRIKREMKTMTMMMTAMMMISISMI
jgi:hypothetical protein